ncbi:hypothetical protein Tco_1155369 [Tanacetum coccineum]
MAKAKDQRSQSMKEQAYNVDKDKDHKRLATKAISLISRRSVTMNSLRGRFDSWVTDTADVPEIYMQEFWATATVYHHSIHFKMNNKKHIVNLEYFREMLQICPKLPDQQFEEPPFEEEIHMFLRDLGHSGEIKVITDVNVNKLHQP